MERNHAESGGGCEREEEEKVCVFDQYKCDPVSKTCLSLRTQGLLWLAKPSQFLFLDTENGLNWRFGVYQGGFYFVTHCTDVGSALQTRSSTTTCPSNSR